MRQGVREARSLKMRARNAVCRARRVGAGRYMPTFSQWMVVFALHDAGGLLPTGGCTTAGAHVELHAAQALESAGLVTINAERHVVLTANGWQRARYRW